MGGLWRVGLDGGHFIEDWLSHAVERLHGSWEKTHGEVDRS